MSIWCEITQYTSVTMATAEHFLSCKGLTVAKHFFFLFNICVVAASCNSVKLFLSLNFLKSSFPFSSLKDYSNNQTPLWQRRTYCLSCCSYSLMSEFFKKAPCFYCCIVPSDGNNLHFCCCIILDTFPQNSESSLGIFENFGISSRI